MFRVLGIYNFGSDTRIRIDFIRKRRNADISTLDNFQGNGYKGQNVLGH